MRGIILAGGSGTRLHPITRGVCKQLLPVFDKPMIYYPLSILMLAGIREICIITTPQDQQVFKNLLGDGSQIGITLHYIQQPKPEGLAQAFILARDFIQEEPCCLVLGDNLFHGETLHKTLINAAQRTQGSLIFGYQVRDPERYGVVAFDDNKKAISLEEKPTNPQSRYAVTGLYFYDGRVAELASTIKPSPRGELEITDLNRLYMEEGSLAVQLLGRGIAWLDTGTFESLQQASSFVQAVQERQGTKIACIEEIAWQKGFIDSDQLHKLGSSMEKNDYGQYLLELATS